MQIDNAFTQSGLPVRLYEESPATVIFFPPRSRKPNIVFSSFESLLVSGIFEGRFLLFFDTRLIFDTRSMFGTETHLFMYFFFIQSCNQQMGGIVSLVSSTGNPRCDIASDLMIFQV